MDRLTGMEIFIRTVELGSLARAAEEAGLSAGMVGKHLRALETRLGVPLLLRTTRKITLTGPGRTYYERCRSILADIDEADRQAADEHTEPRGILRLTAPVMFGGMHLSGAVAAFRALHPQLAVDVTLGNLYADLTDGDYDLAIRVGRKGEDDLVVRRLTVCSTVTCAAPSYLHTRGTPQVPADLRQHDCLINLHERQPHEWTFHGPGGPEAVTVSGPIHSNNALMLRGAAVAGAGIVRMPSFMLGEELQAGRLVVVLHDHAERDIGIHAVALPSSALSRKVRLFTEFLMAHFGPRPPWEAWHAPAPDAGPPVDATAAPAARR